MTLWAVSHRRTGMKLELNAKITIPHGVAHGGYRGEHRIEIMEKVLGKAVSGLHAGATIKIKEWPKKKSAKKKEDK